MNEFIFLCDELFLLRLNDEEILPEKFEVFNGDNGLAIG